VTDAHAELWKMGQVKPGDTNSVSSAGRMNRRGSCERGRDDEIENFAGAAAQPMRKEQPAVGRR